jgi:hypothetical protein
MTTYTRSVTATLSNAVITQNADTTDTVEVTVTMPSNLIVSTITASNCSRTPASMSSGSTCTVTFSGTGFYSVVFTGSTGGKDPTFYQATLNGNIGSSVTAPTASNVIITGESTAQENTTATVNLSANGSGGTLQYACEVGDTTPDNWQTSNIFNDISRGSGTVYARARRSTTALSNVVTNNQPDFLIGDSVFSSTSDTIAHNDSSATTEIGSPSGPAGSGETIAVRVDGGSTNLATGLVDSNGEVDITFSSSLPSAGNSETYRLFVRRPTGTGGDGSTFNSTDMTFTVTRTAAPSSDTTPNDFDFTNQTGVPRNSARESANTVTIGGMDSGVSTTVTISGGTYSKNGGANSSATTTASNGTTFKVQHTSSSNYSTDTTTTLTVGGVEGAFVSTTEASPSATYTVTAPASINEGSAGSFTVSSSNAPNATLFWTVTPTTDFATSEDSFTLSSNSGSFTVTPTADSSTEGAETATIKIRSGSVSGTVLATDTFIINDTSTSPSASYTVTPPASINEGSSGTINITTTNVAQGTEIFWAVTPSSLVSGSSTDSEDTDSSGAASFTITTSSVTGNQTATVKLRTGSQGGSVVASSTFIVNDTSTSSEVYGMLINNYNGESILDTRTDKHSTLLKSGTLSIPPSTNQIVINNVYVNPENVPSDVVNFGAPNTNSYTVWKATSAGTLSGAGKVGALETVAVTGVTAASANANETGIIIVDSPGGAAFALYSFQPNASTEISDNNIAFTSFYTVSKSIDYMAVKY